MTDKEIIIDGYKLEDIKNLLFTGQKMAISTKTFEAMVDKIIDYYRALDTIQNICDEMDGVYPLSQDILNIIDEVNND